MERDREALLARVRLLTSELQGIVATLGTSDNATSSPITVPVAAAQTPPPSNSTYTPTSSHQTHGAIEEIRRRFEPYNVPYRHNAASPRGFSPTLFQNIRVSQLSDVGRSRHAVGTSRRFSGRASPKAAPKFTRRIVFLGWELEDVVPTADRLAELAECGIKEDAVISDRNCSGEQLLEDVCSLFRDNTGSKFHHINNLTWILGYVRGRGIRNITFWESPPSPAKIIALGIHCLYAKPSQDVVPTELPANPSVTLTPPIQRVDAGNAVATFDNYSGLSHLDFVTLIRGRISGIQSIIVDQVSVDSISIEDELSKFRDSLCAEMLTRVRFNDVETIDIGGPLRAYAFTLLKKIVTVNLYKSVPIFEGELDHFLPSRDFCLLSDSVFYSMGRFLAFCIVNLEYGFFGLSKVIPHYLFGSDNFEELVDLVELGDIPNEEYRKAVIQLDEMKGKLNGSLFVIQNEVRAILYDSGWTYTITLQNLDDAVQHLKLYSVFTVRKQQLEQFRNGFQSTKVFRWLAQNPSNILPCFLDSTAIKPTLPEILALLKPVENCTEESLQNLRRYLTNISDDEKKLCSFVEAVTGSTLPGISQIHVKEDINSHQFRIDVCSSSITVVPNLTQMDFFQRMETLLLNSSYGFSSY